MSAEQDVWIVASSGDFNQARAMGLECRMADAVGDVGGRSVKLLGQNGNCPVDLNVYIAIERTASQVDIEDELPNLPVTDAQEPGQATFNGHDSPLPDQGQEPAVTVSEPAQDAAESTQSVTLARAPNVNLDEARRFLGLLDSTTKTHTFQTYDDDKARRDAGKEQARKAGTKYRDPLASVLHGPFERHAGALVAKCKKRSGVFVMVNAGDGDGRREQNVVRIRAVFADLDGVPLKSALHAAALMPHIIVESSRGRWWLFWLVDGLMLDEFRGVQMSIALKLGSDPSVIDPPRVARLPGFLHQKGDPFLSRIVYPKAGDSVRAPYSAEEILSTFPPVEKRITAKKSTASVTGKTLVPIGLDAEEVTDETIADLRSALAFLPADDAIEPDNAGLSNKMWSDKAYQLKTLGEAGRALFHEYSRKSAFYNEVACDDIFDRVQPTRTSYKAIYAEAQSAGWPNPRSSAATNLAEATCAAPVDMAAAVERLRSDPGALFEPGVLGELKRQRSVDPAAFARLRAQVKAIKNVSMAEFERLTAPSDDGAAEVAGIEFPVIEPCAETVDGAALLTELAALFTAHVKLPKFADVVLALWVMLTYLADAADVLPMLLLSSPEKGCGKTTLLALLDKLVSRPLAASSITPAALFRVIEQAQPTLLIDEVDSFLKANEEMRGLLDSGHTRAAAFVLRTVEINKKWEVCRFSTFGPKILSGIGRLPGTIEDRSLVITLQRKRVGETVKRLRHKDQFCDLCSRCLRWALDHKATVFESEPVLPEFLQNRTGDNWSPLFSIATVVGNGWAELVVDAANEFAGVDSAADSGAGVDLLRDLRAAFEGRKLPDRVSSENIITHLVAIEDGRWRDYCRGKEITSRQVAALLKPFLIKSKSLRFGNDFKKGYEREQFNDAFARYLPALREPVAVITSSENR